MPLRVRQLRTPSDFEAQAAATQLRRQTTLSEQARLREVTASQQGRVGEYGSLQEAYGAKAREEKSVREFASTKREWEEEDRQIAENQRMNKMIGNAASGLKKSVSGMTGLEAQTALQANYERIKPQLIASGIPADRLPPTVNIGQLDQLIAQSRTADQRFELEKIRLQNMRRPVTAATVSKEKLDIKTKEEAEEKATQTENQRMDDLINSALDKGYEYKGEMQKGEDGKEYPVVIDPEGRKGLWVE